MVGVPRQSRGCENCRRRKKGCDRQWPRCGGCQKSGVRCHYEQRKHVFINNTDPKDDDSSRKLHFKSYSVSAQEAVTAATTSAVPSLEPKILPESLSRSMFKDKILGFYWSNYLPNGRSLSKDLVPYSQFGWTINTPEIYQERSIIQLMVLTSAMGMMAHRSKDPVLLTKAQSMYGTSLVVMADAVQRPALRRKDSMLVASALLGIFELTYGSKSDGLMLKHQRWSTHTMGNAALILSREPKEYQHGYSHMLFSDLRIVHAFLGMRICKPSAFAATEWKIVPFEEVAKTPKDSIADIALELPGLYSGLQDAKDCSTDDERTDQLQTIASKSWLLDFELRTWADTTGRPILDFVNKKIASGSSPMAMTSEEYAKANTALVYWIACISLYDIIAMTGDTFESPRPTHADPRLYCRDLAKFLPFLAVPQAGCLVTNFTFFAVDTAIQYLNKVDEDIEGNATLLRVFEEEFGRSL